NFQILRRHRRSLLLRLEHPHRSAVENHVHRPPRLGSRRSLNLRIGIKRARKEFQIYVAPVIGTKITEERFMMDEPSGVRTTRPSGRRRWGLRFPGLDRGQGQNVRSVFHKRRFSLRSPKIKRPRPWAQKNNAPPAIYINPKTATMLQRSSRYNLGRSAVI